MTTAAPTERELKYADKIAKLLNKAETTTIEEAETIMETVARLMTEYAIDEAMIAAAQGLTVDELVQDEFRYSSIYRTGAQRLGSEVATHFGLKCVFGRDSYSKPKYMPLYVAGFKSDVERARLLDTSLQIQCVTAMRQWQKTVDFSWMDKGLAFRTRRDFVFGFASGAGSRLRHARFAAQAEAAKHEAERAGTSEASASESVALVLVDRKQRVDEYYDTVWGGRTRNVSHRYSSGVGGRDAGRAAGQNANMNVGSNNLAGQRKALG